MSHVKFLKLVYFVSCSCILTPVSSTILKEEHSKFIQRNLQKFEVQCPQGIIDNVKTNYPMYTFTCGEIEVPVYYDRNTDQTIKLTYLYFPPPHAAQDTPFVHVIGGPSSAIQAFSEPEYFNNSFKNLTEFIDRFGLLIFNYRGEQYSSPVTNTHDNKYYCDRIKYTSIESRPTKTKECLEYLKSNATYDIYSITNENKAHDLNEIIRQLGFYQIHYYGNSYGALLGQYFIRLYPNRLASMILQSAPLYGATFYDDLEIIDHILQQTDIDCLNDKFCVENFGTIYTKYLKALEDLDNNPILLNGGAYKVNGERFTKALSYLSPKSKNMNKIYNIIKNYRDIEMLNQLDWEFDTQKIEFNIFPFTWFNVLCSERALDLKYPSPYRFKHIAADILAYDNNCQAWYPNFPENPSAHVLSISQEAKEVPVLLISGELDDLTPAYQSAYIKESLGSDFVQQVTYKWMDHAPFEVNGDKSCQLDNMLNFLSHPKEKITRICKQNPKFDINEIEKNQNELLF